MKLYPAMSVQMYEPNPNNNNKKNIFLVKNQ